MAGEEVFVANAILSFTGIGVFLLFFYLAYKEKSIFFQYISISGILMVMTYALTVQRTAFNVTGLYDLRDMAFTILDILIWVFMLVFLLMLVVLINFSIRALYRSYTGQRDYEKKSEKWL